MPFFVHFRDTWYSQIYFTWLHPYYDYQDNMFFLSEDISSSRRFDRKKGKMLQLFRDFWDTGNGRNTSCKYAWKKCSTRIQKRVTTSYRVHQAKQRQLSYVMKWIMTVACIMLSNRNCYYSYPRIVSYFGNFAHYNFDWLYDIKYSVKKGKLHLFFYSHPAPTWGESFRTTVSIYL